MQRNISRLVTETVVALFQTNGKMLEWGDAFTAPFGLTSARWQILGAIALAEQNQTAPQIAELMGVSRQGAQKQLNLLIEDGLVEKLQNPAHQRSPHYRLTEIGQSLFQRVNLAWETHAAETGEQLSTEDLEITLRTLKQLAKFHDISVQAEADET